MNVSVSFSSAVLLCILVSSAHSACAAPVDGASDSRPVALAGVDAVIPSESARENAPIASGAFIATDPLAQVQLANELLYSDLQNFVCNERIDRYKGPLSGPEGRRIDTVTSKVSFENGVEQYTGIRQNNRSLPHLSSISGAWSEGEFGTLLRQTQVLLGSQVVLSRTDTDLNGAPAVLYRFEVSEQDSPWDLDVDARHYRVPFHTDVWVSSSSRQILKIERTSTAMPLETRISELRWSVILDTVELNGKNWLLPNAGEYEVIYEESHRREWNLMIFSDYHRYSSEVALRFDTK